MREWIIVASRAEAKIFERGNKVQDLRLYKTLTNKKGRRREHEFETDRPGRGFAKFSGSPARHAFYEKHAHANEVATKFAHRICREIMMAYNAGRFGAAIIFSEPKLLGKIKGELAQPNVEDVFTFINKNVEKMNTREIQSHLAG